MMRLNPFAYFTEDGQKATWILAQFGRSQADRVHGKTFEQVNVLLSAKAVST